MADAPPLRIGIDARELSGTPTGVGRYLRELLDRWTRRHDAARRELVLYRPASAGRGAALDGVAVREVPGAGGTLWEQIALPAAARTDRLSVFFAPAYTAPLALAAPAVLVVHDLSYVAQPAWFPWRTGLRRRLLTRLAAQRAARVLTVSDFSRTEIVHLLGVPDDRIQVILHGPPATARFGRQPAPVADRLPLVLFVGSIFNRRHVLDLVRAFGRVASQVADARLVIAGPNRTHPREDPLAEATRLRLGDRVSVLDYVTDATLGELYSQASAFVFLSEYEGFGLTPLEALAMRVPVVVHDTPVAREIYGEAAAYVRHDQPEAVAAAVVPLLRSAAAREAALAPADHLFERYSWDRAADETLAALEAVGRASGRVR